MENCTRNFLEIQKQAQGTNPPCAPNKKLLLRKEKKHVEDQCVEYFWLSDPQESPGFSQIARFPTVRLPESHISGMFIIGVAILRAANLLLTDQNQRNKPAQKQKKPARKRAFLETLIRCVARPRQSQHGRI